jgi:hypothetical protein
MVAYKIQQLQMVSMRYAFTHMIGHLFDNKNKIARQPYLDSLGLVVNIRLRCL